MRLFAREKEQDRAVGRLAQSPFPEMVNTRKVRQALARQRRVRMWRWGIIVTALVVLGIGLWGLLGPA